MDSSTGEAGKRAGKDLENRLNQFDKTVNALDDDTNISITNNDGKETGSLTGKEFKAIWNKTKFSITSKSFNNGGAGGGASGGFNKRGRFKGKVELSPGAISAYQNTAVKLGHNPSVGTDTLVFHEYGHLTRPGNALVIKFPVTPTINMIRERGTSSIGRALATSVGANFNCMIPRGCN